MASVTFDNATRLYPGGTRPAVDKLNLEVADGEREVEFERLAAAAAQADILGLEVHAGHGLDYDTAPRMLAIPEVRELNIGHFLIGESIFVGLDAAIRRMRAAMDAAA